jgi:hypothetical protein
MSYFSKLELVLPPASKNSLPESVFTFVSCQPLKFRLNQRPQKL